MWRKIINIFLLALLLFFVPGMCSAETVQISAQDLTELKTQLVILDQNNEQLAVNLTQSEQALETAQTQLTLSANQIVTLKGQLATLRQRTEAAEKLSRTAESDLQNVNQLLTTYNKETKSEIAALKRQNKMYQLSLIGVAIMAMMK